MKNTQNKLILAIATLVAVFGIAHSAFAATAPIMSTSSVTSITNTSATLNGFYNDGGSGMTQLFFDYGTSPVLGNLSSLATLPSASSGNYSVTISGLTPGTTYYVQAVGTNSVGTTWGNPMVTFTTKSTSSASPVMSTTSATNITSNYATLNGFYNMNNSLGSVYFEYGTSSGSLNSTTSNISVSSNSGNYSANLSGLAPNTTYYYRAVGNNTNGTSRSTTILSFTTISGSYNPTNNKCYINSFSSSSYYISPNSVAYLSWNTTNCTNATLSPSGYNSTYSSGYAVYPSSNTNTYTLYASNGTSSDTSYVTITTNNGGYNPNPNPYYPPNPPYYPPYYDNNYNNQGYGDTYNTHDYYTNPDSSNSILNKVKSVFTGTSNTSTSNNVVKSNSASSNNGNTLSKNQDINNQSSLAAAVGLSSGSFFPNTFFGWLVLILIILVIAMIVRTITKKKSAHVAHH